MIRVATSADAPKIWLLIQELALYEKQPLDGSLDALTADLGRTYWAFVYEKEEVGIVAYAIVFPIYSTFRTKSSLYLEDLYVAEDHRHQGIGREMLEFLIDEAKRLGYGRFEWSVLDWNQPAIDLYEKLGATVYPDWRKCRITF